MNRKNRSYNVREAVDKYFEATEKRSKSAYNAIENTKKTEQETREKMPWKLEAQENHKKLVQETANKKVKLREELETEYQVLLIKLSEDLRLFGAEKCFEMNSKEIEKFKQKSLDYKTIKSEFHADIRSTAFNALIFDLCKIDPRAILFGDVENYTHELASEVRKLNEEDRKTLQKILEKHGMFEEMHHFVASALKNFPDYIDRMDFTQTMYALTLDPSAFKKLTKSQLEAFENPQKSELNKAVQRNCKLICYLPQNLLHLLTENHPSTVKDALLKHPELLEYFEPNFFAQHKNSLNRIFSGCRKPENRQKYAQLFAPYIDKFPALKEFFKDSLELSPNY